MSRSASRSKMSGGNSRTRSAAAAEDRTFQAVRCLLPQDGPRRPGSSCEMVGKIVEKTLDTGGRFERAVSAARKE